MIVWAAWGFGNVERPIGVFVDHIPHIEVDAIDRLSVDLCNDGRRKLRPATNSRGVANER